MPWLRADKLKLLPAVALVAAMGVLGACGGDDEPDLARGKQLFTERCGACHVLENAGTRGVQGPNLDLAFKRSLEDGLGRSTIEGVVEKQIVAPMGRMPANLVEGEDVEAVAAYVADAIGRKGGAAAAGPSGTARANARNVVAIPADPGGQLAYGFRDATAKAGRVTLESKNDSSVPHNIALKDGPTGAVVSGGEVSRVSTSLEAGSYEFYCSVPGHEQAGMKGTLSVK